MPDDLKEQAPTIFGIVGDFDELTDADPFTVPIGELRTLLSALRQRDEALTEGRNWLEYAIKNEWTPDSLGLACRALTRMDAILTGSETNAR